MVFRSLGIRELHHAVLAAAVLFFIGSAGNAYGDTFTMTWTGPYGSGTADLTATPDGGDVWSVTSLTGTQDGLAITLLDTSVYGGNDNDIYQPPTYGYVVDRAGFGFTDGTHDFNIFDDNASTTPQECSSAVNTSCFGSDANSALSLTSLTITPGTGTSTAPEPASASLLGIMVLGAAALIRRKYRVS
jgi:MYXO-CTERM domain-containing protein